VHLIRSGCDLSNVSYWLGYAHLNTTHSYVEIDMDRKRKMLERTNPPRTRTPPPWHDPKILNFLDSLASKALALCEAGG